MTLISTFLKNTAYLLTSAFIFSGGLYSYCTYKAKINQKQYLQSINSQSIKDASRLTNQSFGISWGFQADDTVMQRVDSGDIFFIKFQCSQCLDPISMLKCYKMTIPLLENQYHTIGISYRDQDGLFCYFNQFDKSKFINYSQLVSLPYLKELVVQKTNENIHNKIKNLLENDKYLIGEQNEKKIGTIKQQKTLEFINRTLRKVDIIKQQQEDVKDLRQLFNNQQKINIRTETNKTLRSL